jgi:LysR family carnitine catabolism transcriptional activator
MERIEAQSKARSGRLRIASVPSVATILLPPFLQVFLHGRPDLDIDLVDTDSTDVRLLVETGQVDLGIAGTGPDLPGLVCEPIFRDPFKLVCRSDSPLSTKGGVLDWQDLADHPLIINEATRALPSVEFQRLARDARFSVRNVTSLLAMVSAGMGITLLPALATVNLPAILTARPLRDPACLRTVGIHWREGKVPSPVTSLFRNDFAAAARAHARLIGLEAIT